MIYSTELAVFVEKLLIFSGFSIRMGVSVEESVDLRSKYALTGISSLRADIPSRLRRGGANKKEIRH